MLLAPLALAHGRPGELQAEPGEVVEDPLLGVRDRALGVGVVDAQQQLAAEAARGQGVGDRDHGGAEVERARRGRREAEAGRGMQLPWSRMRWMQDALLDWFADAERDLPWRRTRDPYAILVSEVMLQQTQVARVLERYEPWLERWPTPAALAAAPAADVLRAWSGLGYNRRALNLQNAARQVVELGGFPRDVEGLERLPGHRPVHGARDRVLRVRRAGHGTRHQRAPRARALARHDRTCQPPPGRAWDWNQALFDLGAQVCLARVPRCERCPLAAACPSRGLTFAPLRRQSRFEGSRRQHRAALVRELAQGPRADGGYDRDVVESLLADGLAVRRADGLLALPEEIPAS